MEKRDKLKPIPRFKNEDEEAAFWLTHDTTEYFDYSKRVTLHFPNLKPSTQSVTVRLPKPLVRLLKMLANEQDVPYQSLLKTFLDEKVKEKLALKQKAVQRAA
jgi:predicted DNA binding CopG/RHH family protein